MKFKKVMYGILEGLGFLCFVLTFFHILALIVLFEVKVLGADSSIGMILLYTIMIGGAMCYVGFHLRKKDSNG